MIGINLSGAEFGKIGGAYGHEYIYPSAKDLKFYADRGVELVRLPVRWERLQPTAEGELSTAELGRLKNFLNEAAKLDMKVIVDVHNYGGYFGKKIGSESVSVSQFADFWQKLAGEIGDIGSVHGYDLMNEPSKMGSASIWPQAAQAAVDAIRTIDMDTKIYVEGNNWASALNWSRNNALLDIKDPANKIVYEAHIYFDRWSTGTYTESYDAIGATPDKGAKAIQDFVRWLDERGAEGLIGEFAVPDNDPRWLDLLDNFLAAVNDAGLDATYWGAGPWWGGYPLALRNKDGSESAQLDILEKHMAESVARTAATDAFEALCADADGAMRNDSGAPAGHKVSTLLDDGTLRVESFALCGSGTGHEIITNDDGMLIAQRFDAQGDHQGSTRTRWEQGGVVTKEEFSASDAFLGAKQEQTESNGVVQTRSYDADWTMTGGQRVTGQDTATVKTEFYDADWAYVGKDITVTRGDVVATTHYDAEDKVIGRERVVSLASEITRKEFLEADGTIAFKEYHGTTGDDVITGTPGTSHFHAGAGSDLLKGGSGQDHFYFETAIGKDVDRISGFAAGKDKIHLDHDIFTALGSSGTLSADQFILGTLAQDEDDHLLYDAKSGGLFYDVDGNGDRSAVQIAQIKVNGTLAANDFLLF